MMMGKEEKKHKMQSKLHKQLGMEGKHIPMNLLEKILLMKDGDILKVKINGEEKTLKIDKEILRNARECKKMQKMES